jgi:hypothetical protein
LLLGDLRILREHGLADNGRGCIDRLHAFIVFEHPDAIIGAIDHDGRIGAGRLLGQLLLRGSVTTRERDELFDLQGVAIGGLEGQKRGRRVHEFSRGREPGLAAARDPFSETGRHLEVIRPATLSVM